MKLCKSFFAGAVQSRVREAKTLSPLLQKDELTRLSSLSAQEQLRRRKYDLQLAQTKRTVTSTGPALASADIASSLAAMAAVSEFWCLH